MTFVWPISHHKKRKRCAQGFSRIVHHYTFNGHVHPGECLCGWYPVTLKEAFSIALRGDSRVTKAYAKPTIVTVSRPSGQEPIKIVVIESSSDRRYATFHNSDVRTGQQTFYFRCRKPGHHAAQCLAPVPISSHVVSTNSEGLFRPHP